MKDRLWRKLLDYAIEGLGADSFSAQMDLLEDGLPASAREARESLIAHTQLQQPNRSFLGLKPPRWPLEPTTRKWIEEAGPWIYRLTIWKEKTWLLESGLWAKFFSLVARPEDWSRLQAEKPWLDSLKPPPRSEPLRKQDESERRGWSLTRPMRVLIAFAAAVVVAALSSLDEGSGWIFGGTFAGLVVYMWLPAREPGPVHRFIARARFPMDSRFDRRFSLTLGLGVIGALVAAVATPLAWVSEPGSGWRIGWIIAAVVGGTLAVYSAGVTTWWTFKYRRAEPP